MNVYVRASGAEEGALLGDFPPSEIQPLLALLGRVPVHVWDHGNADVSQDLGTGSDAHAQVVIDNDGPRVEVIL